MRIEKFLMAAACVLLTGLAQAGVKTEHWTTPTGARVYFVASDALPILDVQIDIPAGSAQDPAGKSGLAAITRSLLDAAPLRAASSARPMNSRPETAFARTSAEFSPMPPVKTR